MSKSTWTPQNNDFIIPVMGMSGAGKSTFINYIAGEKVPVTEVGHDLKSCTSQVLPFVIKPSLGNGRRLILVDTPGYGDGDRSDAQIQDCITSGLKKLYRNELNLAGIIYIHDISSTRIFGLDNLNFVLGLKLNPRNMVLCTTKWSVPDNLEAEKERAKQLEEKYWKEVIKKGSTVHEFKNSHESAWKAVNLIIQANVHHLILLFSETRNLKLTLLECLSAKVTEFCDESETRCWSVQRESQSLPVVEAPSFDSPGGVPWVFRKVQSWLINLCRGDTKIAIIYLKHSRGSVGLSDSSQPTHNRGAMKLLGESTLSPNILFANFTESLGQTNGKTGVATSHLDYIFGDSDAPSLREGPWDMLGAAIAKSVGLQPLLHQLTGMVTPTNERNGHRFRWVVRLVLLRQMRGGRKRS